GEDQYPLRLAEFLPHFDAGLVAVTGRGAQTKGRWGKVFIYSLTGGELVHQVTSGPGRYLNFVGFDASGKQLISEVMSQAGVTESIIITDLATKKDTEMELAHAGG